MTLDATEPDAVVAADPELRCDLIMKGGLTSGVVFPQAITRLATRYRFVNIGGTSAGAIAAVMTAAAEYRRAHGATAAERRQGFEAIDAMAGDLSQRLASLFQPAPATLPLFRVAMAVIAAGGTLGGFVRGALSAYRLHAALAAIPGLALAILAATTGEPWAWVLALALVAAGPAVAIAWRLWHDVTVVLPAHDFGICSGLGDARGAEPGFTEWMADQIDAACGRDPGAADYRPLTTGDLRGAEPSERRITVASVATDLSSGRPYQLPLGTRVFSFRKAEFERLFPPRILAYLVNVGGRLLGRDGTPFRDAGGNDDYYTLPAGDDFPVLLVARLSLSFPGLISAVPLYRFDYTVPRNGADDALLVRCLFSDGGITSNFPIHFFDRLLPGRPTFGISLGSLDPRAPQGRRIVLPVAARAGALLPAHPIGGLLTFAAAILSTARNWQDTLQSRLHGYRERIVEIRLDDSNEGGLNLDMDEDTRNRLLAFGDEAAQALLTRFDFDEHRWRRAVTALPALGEALAGFAEVWDASYREVLLTRTPTGLTGLSPAERQRLADFAAALAAVGKPLTAAPLPKVSKERALVRVVARIDTD